MAFFKGKAVQITMVDPSPADGNTEPSQRLVELPPETIEKVGQVARELVQDVGKIVLVWVAADTARKVIVELAKK